MSAEKKKIKYKGKIDISLIIAVLKCFFSIQKRLLSIKHINYPKGQFILSLWHSHQCLSYGVKDKSNFYVLISASNDGEIVARAIECLDLKSVRGSSKRHGASAALSLIDKLKDGGSAAIMVDGPRGPRGKVKEGIVNISKLSGVPIIPAIWASKDITFLKFNSWDFFRIPFGPCRTVALYGDPIYIPAETTKEEMSAWCEKIEQEMNRLEKDLDENYEKYRKMKE